jgi:renalase
VRASSGAGGDGAEAGAAQRRVAVVGAGISGLTAASKLAAAGCAVTVLETGRGPGGRTSTRRGGPDGSGWQWDHGRGFHSSTRRST